MVPANEALIHRVHRHAGSPGIAGPRENRPALRDRIDPALGVARRTERRAVVEVRAAVPLAVPAVLLDLQAHFVRLHPATFGEGHVTGLACDLGEPHEHFIKEESQPDAFPFAVLSHKVHPVVPVAGPHERQAVLAGPEASQDRSPAMFVQAGRFVRPGGKIVVGILLHVHRAPFDEVDGFVQHPGIPRAENVTARRQGQPEEIIGTFRTDASARGGMPPVLDVSLPELAGRASQQMLAQKVRLGVYQRHGVLQLVAEPEGAPRLVVPAPGPDTARQSLVKEPTVGQDVDGRVGGNHLHRPESPLPVLPDRFEHLTRRRGPAEAIHQGPGVVRVFPRAEPEDDLPFLPVGQTRTAPGSRRRDPGRPPLCPKAAHGSWRPGSEASRCVRGIPPGRRLRSEPGSSTSKNATRSVNSVL